MAFDMTDALRFGSQIIENPPHWHPGIGDVDERLTVYTDRKKEKYMTVQMPLLYNSVMTATGQNSGPLECDLILSPALVKALGSTHPKFECHVAEHFEREATAEIMLYNNGQPQEFSLDASGMPCTSPVKPLWIGATKCEKKTADPKHATCRWVTPHKPMDTSTVNEHMHMMIQISRRFPLSSSQGACPFIIVIYWNVNGAPVVAHSNKFYVYAKSIPGAKPKRLNLPLSTTLDAIDNRRDFRMQYISTLAITQESMVVDNSSASAAAAAEDDTETGYDDVVKPPRKRAPARRKSTTPARRKSTTRSVKRTVADDDDAEADDDDAEVDDDDAYEVPSRKRRQQDDETAGQEVELSFGDRLEQLKRASKMLMKSELEPRAPLPLPPLGERQAAKSTYPGSIVIKAELIPGLDARSQDGLSEAGGSQFGNMDGAISDLDMEALNNLANGFSQSQAYLS